MSKDQTLSKDQSLMDQMFSQVNILRATRQVRMNNGAAGVDGVKPKDAAEFVLKNVDQIRAEIETRTYKPLPLRRVCIPKDDGTKKTMEQSGDLDSQPPKTESSFR